MPQFKNPEYIRGLKHLIREIRELIRQYRKRPYTFHNQGHVNKMLDYVRLRGKTLLMVGLGRGLEVPIFFEEGCRRIIGLDPYPQVKAEDFGAHFELLQEFGESIPLEAETCDVVYTVASLEHVSDPKRVVQEMMRVLKPGGILYCSTAPLWFSAYGYHAKQQFPDLYDPWFHLIYSKEEYINTHPNIKNSDVYLERLDDIYDHPTNYNRLPSQVYYEIVNDLIEEHFSLMIEFTGIPESTKLLADNPGLANKLDGHDLRDLITRGVTVIVQKK